MTHLGFIVVDNTVLNLNSNHLLLRLEISILVCRKIKWLTKPIIFLGQVPMQVG